MMSCLRLVHTWTAVVDQMKRRVLVNGTDGNVLSTSHSKF